MKAGWRWYGAKDAISLREIRQAGVTDVVAVLYGLAELRGLVFGLEREWQG